MLYISVHYVASKLNWTAVSSSCILYIWYKLSHINKRYLFSFQILMIYLQTTLAIIIVSLKKYTYVALAELIPCRLTEFVLCTTLLLLSDLYYFIQICNSKILRTNIKRTTQSQRIYLKTCKSVIWKNFHKFKVVYILNCSSFYTITHAYIHVMENHGRLKLI